MLVRAIVPDRPRTSATSFGPPLCSPWGATLIVDGGGFRAVGGVAKSAFKLDRPNRDRAIQTNRRRPHPAWPSRPWPAHDP